VLIEKYLSVENELTPREGILLNSYFLLKRMGLNEKKAFGLDKSDVDVEWAPLVYHPIQQTELVRIRKKSS
jgi:KUP system potassium uptake protein